MSAHPPFLWPTASLPRVAAGPVRPRPIKEVERQLQDRFPGGHAILCSSGRAAIALYLTFRHMGRPDAVEVFPYASHCVLDAVARRATPVPFGAARRGLRIVYHQWGYVQETGLGNDVLEDAVDTLCIDGNCLLPGGGAAEIWSLPKILGTLGGGVIWTRDAEEAETLRRMRNEAGARLSQFALRLLGMANATAHLWWQGAECAFPRPAAPHVGEIGTALDLWDDAVRDRQRKLEMVWHLAPDWLSLTDNRLPPVVPLALNAQGLSLVAERGLCAGIRHMERIDEDGRKLVRMFPVPIHQDITPDALRSVLDQVEPHIEKP